MESPNPLMTIDRQILGDIYTSIETMENLIILCDDFDSRFGGTEGERKAAEFFKTKMEAYGLSNVHLDPVQYTGWIRGTAELEIISPVQKTIPCIALPLSPPTDTEGMIIDMEDGAPQDFDKRADEIKGKIVMTTSVVSPKGVTRWIHRSEKYGRSHLAGAAGFIFVNHYPGYGPATGSIGKPGKAPIPGISICKEDGAFIQRLVKRKGKVKIRLVTTDRYQPMTSWNIMGDLPGKTMPDQTVMVGCHYDGHDITQGAGDPVSGAVAVLETARVLSAYAPNPACNIRFVLWGIEEIGLLGSKAYAQGHSHEMSGIRFYLNLDSAGTKTNNRDIVINEWPELQTLFEKWRDEMALDFAVGQAVNAHSDHYPFLWRVFPQAALDLQKNLWPVADTAIPGTTL